MAAARSLIAQKVEVTILEAQDRAGGRILTLRNPFHDGLYVEAGATHVVGDPLLKSLIDDLGVELTKVRRPKGLSDIEYVKGKRRTLGDDEDPVTEHPLSKEERALGWEGRTKKYFAAVVGQDPRSPSWPPPSLTQLDELTIADYLASLGASPGYIAQVGDGFCPGGSAETASALSILREVANLFVERTHEGGGRIAGGSDRLPRALAKTLSSHMIYGAKVRAVVQDSGGARVEFVRRGTTERIDADFVISAVPSPVLAHIEFSPALSPAKKKAIAELPLASVTRLYLESDQRFWRDKHESGQAFTDLSIDHIRNETELQEGTSGILGAYLTAERAERFGALPEPERLKATRKDIEAVFPEMKQHFTAGASKFWTEDPFQRGAYAWYKPGQLTTSRVDISTSEGRIHFAGDHTSHRPGFMHGALASAARVVEEIGHKIPRGS